MTTDHNDVPAAAASATPRMDAYWESLPFEARTNAVKKACDFARQLERELANVLQINDQLTQRVNDEMEMRMESERELAEARAYKKAWMEWRSLQTGDVHKMMDAARRCESAEAALADAREVAVAATAGRWQVRHSKTVLDFLQVWNGQQKDRIKELEAALKVREDQVVVPREFFSEFITTYRNAMSGHSIPVRKSQDLLQKAGVMLAAPKEGK